MILQSKRTAYLQMQASCPTLPCAHTLARACPTMPSTHTLPSQAVYAQCGHVSHLATRTSIASTNLHTLCAFNTSTCPTLPKPAGAPLSASSTAPRLLASLLPQIWSMGPGRRPPCKGSRICVLFMCVLCVCVCMCARVGVRVCARVGGFACFEFACEFQEGGIETK